jgi:hypothetical protein
LDEAAGVDFGLMLFDQVWLCQMYGAIVMPVNVHTEEVGKIALNRDFKLRLSL